MVYREINLQSPLPFILSSQKWFLCVLVENVTQCETENRQKKRKSVLENRFHTPKGQERTHASSLFFWFCICFQLSLRLSLKKNVKQRIHWSHWYTGEMPRKALLWLKSVLCLRQQKRRRKVKIFSARSNKVPTVCSHYGARHHNWPLFVIAAILLSDVARRQLRYRCKAGNESYPTPLTACACDVRLLDYAWNNAGWLTGD